MYVFPFVYTGERFICRGEIRCYCPQHLITFSPQFFTRLAAVFAEEFDDFFYFSLINLFFTKRSIFIPYI